MAQELFELKPSKVCILLDKVVNGEIGLPTLQRPFVWTDAAIRDLLDSMMKGYPIGFVMLWEPAGSYDKKEQKMLGQDAYATAAHSLVIDGQQRLTALVAAMRGIKVKNKNYEEREVKIAFNPLTREFKVWSAAIARNVEWVPVISEVYLTDSIFGYLYTYINQVNTARTKSNQNPLTAAEVKQIEVNMNALYNLKDYSLPIVSIMREAEEEQVSDIFVRVNSGGAKLTENDFVQTVISVYNKDTHQQMDKFCRECRNEKGISYNDIWVVETHHLIRIAVGVAFRRAKLQYAHLLLRGKNLETGVVSDAERTQNIQKFNDALKLAIHPTNWHHFLSTIQNCGYVNQKLITAKAAVVYSYILYLIGKTEYKVPTVELASIMSKWFYMASVTGFYTNSTETTVEKQFADLREVHNAKEFVDYLQTEIDARFTDEYFDHTLPKVLETSSGKAPAWCAYNAAQIVLNNPLLFTNADFLLNHIKSKPNGVKSSIDKHHIFPKHYLEKIGYSSDRDKNQIANFTYLTYSINQLISDDAPADYVQQFKIQFGAQYDVQLERHAIPKDFENMDYKDFLKERRVLMAQIIKKAYQQL